MTNDTKTSFSRAITSVNTQQLLSLLVFVVAFVAIITSVWMWGKTADYRVLYGNLSDRA